MVTIQTSNRETFTTMADLNEVCEEIDRAAQRTRMTNRTIRIGRRFIFVDHITAIFLADDGTPQRLRDSELDRTRDI